MSSRVSPSKQLCQTAKVRHALDHLEASSGVGRKQGTEAVTHRCRVFRLSSKAMREGASIFTIVWDTLESPFKSGSLPQGEVCFATSGPSPDEVGKEIANFCQRLGRVVISDWHSAGSF